MPSALPPRCISYYSYIKPQLLMDAIGGNRSCISYYSYIKPQQTLASRVRQQVVYRTIPTSNHNHDGYLLVFLALYIVLFLHQTTTYRCAISLGACCISYYSYIKPQLEIILCAIYLVVYRTIPTSNHNLLMVK